MEQNEYARRRGEERTRIHRTAELNRGRQYYDGGSDGYEDLPMSPDGYYYASEKELRRDRKRRKRERSRRYRGKIIRSLIAALAIAVISVVLSAALIVYGRDMLGINSQSKMKIVNIPQGATMTEISQILRKNEIIDRPKFFVFFAGLSGKDGSIKPGDHELRPDMAYETILSELVTAPLDSSLAVTVTFPEGIRLVDAAELLEENGVCDADEFLTYFNNNTSFDLEYEKHLSKFPNQTFYRKEGYLFPDTYSFYKDMGVELVSEKILSNFNSKFTSIYYDRMKLLNVDLDQVLTIASMIQQEAGDVTQMKDISSVFWNRLNNPSSFPKLQSDPTTKYVEQVVKPHSEVYNEELYISYDTYQCSGLPAGPICNPGLDAIDAALYPNQTVYFYFYSDIDTGETFFAQTNDEHEANIAMVEARKRNPLWYLSTTLAADNDTNTTTTVAVGTQAATGSGTDADSGAAQASDADADTDAEDETDETDEE